MKEFWTFWTNKNYLEKRLPNKLYKSYLSWCPDLPQSSWVEAGCFQSSLSRLLVTPSVLTRSAQCTSSEVSFLPTRGGLVWLWPHPSPHPRVCRTWRPWPWNWPSVRPTRVGHLQARYWPWLPRASPRHTTSWTGQQCRKSGHLTTMNILFFRFVTIRNQP